MGRLERLESPPREGGGEGSLLSNAIGEAGGAHLVDTLVDNRSLVTLYYGNTDVSAEQSKVLPRGLMVDGRIVPCHPGGWARTPNTHTSAPQLRDSSSETE